jgi:hypothetical protein
LTPDLRVTKVLGGVTISNGLDLLVAGHDVDRQFDVRRGVIVGGTGRGLRMGGVSARGGATMGRFKCLMVLYTTAAAVGGVAVPPADAARRTPSGERPAQVDIDVAGLVRVSLRGVEGLRVRIPAASGERSSRPTAA